MRCKVSLASGLSGTLILRDSAARDRPSPPVDRPPASDAVRIADVIRGILGAGIQERESFFVVTLDQRKRLINAHQLTVGTLMAAMIHPRDVFSRAFADNAATIVIAHNHPSGDPTPSLEDCQVTQRITDGGKLLGVQLLDHVIVAAETHYSFRETGLCLS